MAQTTTPLPTPARYRPLAVGAAVTALLILLAYWGGFPQDVSLALLVGGLGLLIGILLLFGFLIYWFYVSPLPESEARGIVANRSPLAREIIASGSTIMAILIVIGLFWDELWHRLYGVGLVVDDFWWRPHILIYASMAINSLFALGGMALITWRGHGTLRQRFLAEPLLGLMTLVAGFQVVTAPLDPMWHQVYGLDITAWSLPHLFLWIGLFSVMVVGSSVQLSLVPTRAWRGLGGFTLREGIAALLLALGVVLTLQFGTTEWEALTPASLTRDRPFLQRPEWLYLVVMMSICAFIGMLGLHLFRRVGVTTLIFTLALGVRLLLLTVFDAASPPANLGFYGNLFLLAPGLTLDLWYAYRLRRGKVEGSALVGSLLMAAVMLLVGIPLVAEVMIYPRINSSTLPGMIVFTPLAALVFGAAGARVGTWLRAHGQAAEQVEAEAGTGRERILWIGAGALVAVLAFVALFITTATPPLT